MKKKKSKGTTQDSPQASQDKQGEASENKPVSTKIELYRRSK